MKKVYICGKVTGCSDYREKFKKEETRLYGLGYLPVNPAALISGDTDWPQAMKHAIRAMLLCGGVALLPGWKRSKGARIEARLARELGIEVRECRNWT